MSTFLLFVALVFVLGEISIIVYMSNDKSTSMGNLLHYLEKNPHDKHVLEEVGWCLKHRFLKKESVTDPTNHFNPEVLRCGDIIIEGGPTAQEGLLEKVRCTWNSRLGTLRFSFEHGGWLSYWANTDVWIYQGLFTSRLQQW